ncbi:MAG TPA: hypothetical protein VF680_17020 [Allosphingosinicella sp.]|jgi:hypothetical protein
MEEQIEERDRAKSALWFADLTDAQWKGLVTEYPNKTLYEIYLSETQNNTPIKEVKYTCDNCGMENPEIIEGCQSYTKCCQTDIKRSAGKKKRINTPINKGMEETPIEVVKNKPENSWFYSLPIKKRANHIQGLITSLYQSQSNVGNIAKGINESVEEKERLMQNLKICSFVLEVDQVLADCKPVYELGSDLANNVWEKIAKARKNATEISQQSQSLQEQNRELRSFLNDFIDGKYDDSNAIMKAKEILSKVN